MYAHDRRLSPVVPRSAREVHALVAFALVVWCGAMLTGMEVDFLPDDLTIPLALAGVLPLLLLGRAWARWFGDR